MRIGAIKSNVIFRSGYPTFGTNGHLTYVPDKFDIIYMGYKPIQNQEDQKLNKKLNYLA